MALFNKMTDEEKRAKEREKKIGRFQKELGVFGEPEYVVRKAVLEFAKTCNYGWGEMFLTEAQEKDAEFMLQIFGANEALLNQYYIPRELKSDERFVIGYLKLVYARELDFKKRNNIDKSLKTYEYYNFLKDFPIRTNIEFLTLFARTFPECNIMEVVDKITDENYMFGEGQKMFDQFGAILAKDVCISQARRHGYKFVRHIPSDNPNYLEIMMTGIEKDGFKSLAYLPKEMIWENRDLIVLASKHDHSDGLRRYFSNTLSPRQERDYFCHGELHTNTYMEYEFYPLRKALIEDDALFDAIDAPEATKNELRAEIAKKTKEFYEQVKPYEERGLVTPKNGAEKSVVQRIAQNFQNSKKDSK